MQGSSLRRIWAPLALLAFFLVPAAAKSQPAWCASPKTPDEITICANPHLAQLDQLLGGLYVAVRALLSPSEQLSLRDSQRAWLAQRAACGYSSDCISRLYQTRVPQLRAALAGPAPQPIPIPASPAPAPPATPTTPTTPTIPSPTTPPPGDPCDMFPTLCPRR
jgi:uncharacterized protein